MNASPTTLIVDFVQMFGDVVLGVEHDAFEHLLEAKKTAKGVELDTDFGCERSSGISFRVQGARQGKDRFRFS